MTTLGVSRRSFLAAAGGAVAAAMQARQACAAQAPDIVFIAMDDMNDWIGCLGGHPQAHTPNLDRLAKLGMAFARAQAAVPVCGPSRAAIFSGMAPHRTGIFTNDDKFNHEQPYIETLPEYLAAHGYKTFGAGKLFHGGSKAAGKAIQTYGPEPNNMSPLVGDETRITPEELAGNVPYVRHTVDRGPGKLHAVLPLNQMPRDRNAGSTKVETFDWGPFDITDDDMQDTVNTSWGIARLNERHSEPIFVGFGFSRPHQPLWAPQKYFDLYPEDTLVMPEAPADDLDDIGVVGQDYGRRALTSGLHSTVLKYGQWRAAVRAYLACISYVDAQAGRILDAVEASPNAENTVIVAWGDNGWHLGEKEHWGKYTGWNRATRVPLLIAPAQANAPAGFVPGKTCAKPVNLIDLYPTLAELAGLPPKAGLDGTSLAPLLANPQREWAFATVSAFGRGNYSVASEEWRYLRYYDGSEELYNDSADPREWKNVADSPEFAAIKARLAASVPALPEVEHFVRSGTKWKAILMADGSAELYDLPAEDYVSEANDVSKKYPGVLAKMRAHIQEHGITAQCVTIPEIAP